MNTSILLLLPLLSLLPSSFSQPTTPPLDLACKNLTAQSVSPELCFSVMNKDPRSATASLLDLPLISTDITINNCTDAISFIKSIGNQTEGIVKCLNDFADTIPKLEKARDLVTNKDYLHAILELREDIAVSSRCLLDIAKDSVELREKMEPPIYGFHDVAYVAQAVVGYVDINK